MKKHTMLLISIVLLLLGMYSTFYLKQQIEELKKELSQNEERLVNTRELLKWEQKDNETLKESVSTLKKELGLVSEQNQILKENHNKLVLDMKKLKQEQKKLSSKKELPSRGGYKTYTVEATAYTAYCNGCSGTTKLGTNLRKNPNAKVIAVDPNVIPLGSKVRLTCKSYPEINGIYIADDTGGAIKGHKIDLFIPTRLEALQFGKREVTVEIIR